MFCKLIRSSVFCHVRTWCFSPLEDRALTRSPNLPKYISFYELPSLRYFVIAAQTKTAFQQGTSRLKKSLQNPLINHKGNREGGNPEFRVVASPDTLRDTLKRKWERLGSQRRGRMRWNSYPITVPYPGALFYLDRTCQQKVHFKSASLVRTQLLPVICLATGPNDS